VAADSRAGRGGLTRASVCKRKKGAKKC
jgi:hypothetical protein